MQKLAQLVFAFYIWVFIVSGALSLLLAGWEMQWLFGLPESSFSSLEGRTLLNQYRFLRAIELGFGLFCWALRQEIFSQARWNKMFLLVLLCIPGARSVSLLLDGMAHWGFVALMCAEYCALALLWWVTRPVRQNLEKEAVH